MAQRLSVTDEIYGDEGTIWMPVQVAGEWLWKRISLDSLAENVRTIVVPAGQSFMVTDGEEVPDFEFSVHNRSSLSGDASQSGFKFRANADGGVQYMEVRAHKVLDTESPNYGDGLLYIDMGGVSFLLTVNDAGVSVLESDVDTIRFTKTPVYSSNAAALAGGLTAGMRYRKSTGELYEVY